MNPITKTISERQARIDALNYSYAEQQKEVLDTCNLCGSSYLHTITHVDRYGYPARADVCTDCGLTFLNPRMTQDAYTDFYISTYRPLVSAYHGRTIDATTVQKDQRSYTDYMVEVLAPWLSQPSLSTMLDVGGSTGIVAAGLCQAFDLKATIIDPAPDEVEEAKALGIESITGFVEDYEAGDRKFDVVGMFQTIDHLLDLHGTFEKMRSLIEEDGLLVVDIVDYRNAYLRNWSIPAGIKIDHPYYLTEASTDLLFAKTGFQPVRKITSPDMLHILYVCKPVDPQPDAQADSAQVKRYLEEIRYVQGTPKK